MYEIDKKKFGSFVAQLRKEKGYTQKDLAERLHLSDKAVSKWETGVSIPDTGILIPLAELLGVSVTELLLCEKQIEAQELDAAQVEDLVKTAIQYGDEPVKRAWQEKGRWGMLYGLSLLVGGVLAWVLYAWSAFLPMLFPYVGLSAVFGAYFCFAAPLQLPSYHDEYRIQGMQDGCFRMNLPGVKFNNSNWPHMLRIGRIWGCASMVGAPLYMLALSGLHVDLQGDFANCTLFALVLCSLFVPLYAVGKKYE